MTREEDRECGDLRRERGSRKRAKDKPGLTSPPRAPEATPNSSCSDFWNLGRCQQQGCPGASSGVHLRDLGFSEKVSSELQKASEVTG